MEEEIFLLGRLPPSDPLKVLTPPYEKPETAASEALRELSLRAQGMEAADPARFYVMRLDLVTGDVFAVARSKDAARAHAEALAPDGRAPASRGTAGDDFVEKAISDWVDNRIKVADSAYDSWAWVNDAGFFDSGGSCTATLFAFHTVVTAAHCAILAAGPGMTTLNFSPRQRSYSDTPYGTGATTYVEYETAFTAKGCHTSYVYPDCIYHDFAIVGYGPSAFSHGGYLGFDWLGDVDFEGTYNSNVGYPSCQGSSCDFGVPYADLTCANRHPTLSGGSTANSWPWSGGEHPMHSSACDITGGNSGGALIARADGNILGLEVFSSCSDSNCTRSALGPRINGPIFYWMMAFR